MNLDVQMYLRQVPIVHAEGMSWGCMDIFLLTNHISLILCLPRKMA